MAFPLQLVAAFGAFALGTALAAAFGAANLGTAMSFGQMSFTLALVWLLLRR